MANIPILMIWDEANQKYVSVPAMQGPKGDTGDVGPAGPAGYTPVKGNDYFTEEDKTEMVNAVLAALPAAEGVSY